MKTKIPNSYKYISILILIIILLIFFLYFKSITSSKFTEPMTSGVEQTGAEVTNLANDQFLYVFKNSGSITFAYDSSVKILLVGGGGGGGYDGGGGGGGGGVIEQDVTIKAGTYNIVIGAGGNGATNYDDAHQGKKGGDTIIKNSSGNLYVAIGGGGGGANHGRSRNGNSNQVNGGSGGGQGATSQNEATGPGSGTSGQGYNGANATDGTGGGGGGAGEQPNGKNGGKGYNSKITNTETYYGGGGGGGSWATNSGGAGGAGGGAGGANVNNVNAPSANYYGGGGGGSGWVRDSGNWRNGGTNTAGNGYQGIVIIKLLKPPKAPLPENLTANYNVYTIVDHTPVLLQPHNRLSCTSDNCNTSDKCMAIQLGKNMAISFQINLNRTNNTSSEWQQILGITTDPCGSDKRVFGAFLGGPGKSDIYIYTSFSGNVTESNYSPLNSTQLLSIIASTVGKNMRIDILCNFNQNNHQVYVNNNLVASKEIPLYPVFPSGNAYIFSSFNEFPSVDATIHDVSYLTSDSRTFKIADLTNSTTYIDNNMRNLESFQNVYNPNQDGSYSVEDIRNMEYEILQEINNLNQGYSNYIKYMYNQRHNQRGDTATKLTLYDNSGNPINDNDFVKNMQLYANINESDIYKNLMQDLKVFNEAIKYNAPVDLKYNGVDISLSNMAIVDEEINATRKNLDQKLSELNETENSIYMQKQNDMRGQTLQTILLTTLATSLVYYIFMHAD